MTQAAAPVARGPIVRVFTFKEGLLSRVAHDLEISVQRASLTRDENRVRVECDAGSLSVVGVVVDGRTDPHGLSQGQYREIEDTVRTKILHVARHPRVVFEGALTQGEVDLRLDGTLTLVGRSLPLSLTGRRADGRVTGDVELAPSRWGIEPYRALLGAIKLRDRVRVRFDVADQ